MFTKFGKTQILAYNSNLEYKSDFSKVASTKKYASYFDTVTQTPSIVEDVKEKLALVADTYCISKNPKDYIYIAVRALTADVPNENWDAFAEKELLRFESKHGCRVYQTFNLKPHHVNHRSQDPTQARGVIIDSHYNTKNAEHFPEILVAADKTKDKRLAEGIASGEIAGFSMGCDAEQTVCSVCGNIANTPAQFCDHIKFGKGKDFDGKVAFEWCEGVTFVEESSVDDPADKNAVTQEVILASKHLNVDKFNVESEFLALNSKLNHLLSTVGQIKEGETMAKEASKNTESKEASKNTESKESVVDKRLDVGDRNEKKDKMKRYKEKEDKDKEDEMSPEEFGVKTDEGESPAGTQATKKEDKNPYTELIAKRKEAVDGDAKKVYKKYVKDYGDDAVKDVKPKKIGYIVTLYNYDGTPYTRIKTASYKTASEKGNEWKAKGGRYTITSDTGQEFKKLDNQKGNPPKEFQEKGGNPPKDFKFADKGQQFTKLDNQKGNPPKEFQIDRKKGNPPDKFKFAKVYKDVEVYGVSPTSRFWIVAKAKLPKFIMISPLVGKTASKDEQRDAMKDLLRGISRDGLYVTMKKVNAHKLKSVYAPKYEPSFVDEFEGDMKDSKKFRPRPTKGIEQEGKDDLDAVDRGKVREDSVDADGAKDMSLKHSYVMRKRSQELEPLFKIIEELQAKGTTDAEIIKVIDAWMEGKGSGATANKNGAKVKKKETVKEAAVTDRAIRDIVDVEKVQAEAKTGAPKDGIHDLDGVDRETPKSDEAYAGGRDDLNIKRNQVVDLKASKDQKDDVSPKRASIKDKLHLRKLEAELKQKHIAELDSFKELFKERFVRALRLSAKRADLNIIDNELKLALGDVLVKETEDYVGMDGALALQLVEQGFIKGSDKYIDSILNEATKYVDLPEDSFLVLEEDTNKVNAIIPVVASLGLEQVTTELDPLTEQAEESNPVFVPKDGSTFTGKWDHLRGVFRDRLI